MTVATTLAIAAGILLSETRWYRAFLTALVVFFGARSTGQTLARGWQRLLGTVLGVVVGVLLATAVQGDFGVSLLLVVGGLFLSLYFHLMCLTRPLVLIPEESGGTLLRAPVQADPGEGLTDDGGVEQEPRARR